MVSPFNESSRVDPSRLTLRAQWFGRAAIRSSDGAELLTVGKPLALLAYLECSRTRTATRPAMVQLLWSTDPESVGRTNLRQTLYYLKGRLGTDPIRANGTSGRRANSRLRWRALKRSPV